MKHYQNQPKHPALRALHFVKRQWFNGILLYLAIHLLASNTINIQFRPDGAPLTSNMGIMPSFTSEPNPSAPAFSISNLTPILSPDYGERKGIPKSVIRSKVKICKDYVKTFAPLAQSEMETYGVPASITLAQALLESNAGDSRLAKESANYFGIKCKSKCRGCTCRNYSDDDLYDMFRVFEAPEDSFREHSLLLKNSQRYSRLFDLNPRDYTSWAHGLKAAGYATDKNYAYKLIQIVEALQLDRYDR